MISTNGKVTARTKAVVAGQCCGSERLKVLTLQFTLWNRLQHWQSQAGACPLIERLASASLGDGKYAARKRAPCAAHHYGSKQQK